MPVDLPIPPEYEDSDTIEVPDVIQVTKKKEIRAKRMALMDRTQRARKETEWLTTSTSDQFL